MQCFVNQFFQIKRYAANLLEIDTAVEEETRARADIEDQVATSERKGSLKLVKKLLQI
jgi:hypothetical protein